MPSLQPIRPVTLYCRERTLTVKAPLIMGILNVTPDSFSDGGCFLGVEKAVDHARAMIADGADIIDIGGESTRPGADLVSAAEEIDRVAPVIEALRDLDITLSIDTQKATVARHALAAGAHIVNDVTGARDPQMLQAVADAKAAIVLMHTRGASSEMMNKTYYQDLVNDVARFLMDKAESAKSAGIRTIILDPGIGFAKTAAQNYTLFRRLNEFAELPYPLLIGPSRKSFIGHLTGQAAAERIEGTIAAVVISVLHGAHIVRVHDVAAIKRTLQVTEAIQNG